MSESLAVPEVTSVAGRAYLQYVEMPPLAALQGLANASRELLRHTAELPDSEQGLLDVLAEYRYAVYTFLAITVDL